MTRNRRGKKKNFSKILITLGSLAFFNYLFIYADNLQVTVDGLPVKANFIDTTSTTGAPSTAIALDNVIIDSNQHNGNITYVIKPGDSLVSIAKDVGTTVENIRRVNNLANNADVTDKGTITNKDGIAVSRLTISELPGIIIAMAHKTTVAEFASHYKLDAEDIKSLNNITDAKTTLNAGDELFLTITEQDAIKKGIIPDPNPAPVVTKKPTQAVATTTKPAAATKTTAPAQSTAPAEKPAAPAAKAAPAAETASAAQIVSVSTSSIDYDEGTILSSWFQKDSGYAGFAAGNCTSYAASKRPDIFTSSKAFRGNANAWYANAKAAGNAVGTTPKAGAIAVFYPGRGVSSYGHVGYVEKVDGDKLIISDMNYRGRYVVTKRVIDSATIMGYIY